MKLGLALSGGGVRGAVHIGVIKALEENGIYPDMISGNSSGSIVAALYSSGYKSDQMIDILIKNANKSIVDLNIGKVIDYAKSIFMGRPKKIDGFIDGNRVKKLMDDYCTKSGCKYIRDSLIPLAIPAVDINTSRIVMFVSNKAGMKDQKEIEFDDDIDVATAVRASISYPAVFKPCMVKGKRLVDGGIRDNVPVRILRKMGANRVLAVNLGYVGKADNDIDDALEIAIQAIDIMAYQITRESIKEANYVLLPEVYDVRLLEVSRIPECIERGYKAALKSMPAIRRALYY